ncbi:MAG TPA: stage V sporulation protein AD [Bacillota bacterium]
MNGKVAVKERTRTARTAGARDRGGSGDSGGGRRVAEAPRRVGRHTIVLPNRPPVAAVATVSGPMEGRGPLGAGIDHVHRDRLLGQSSWELAESRLLVDAAERCCRKAGIKLEDVDVLLAGDLLNQIISSTFAARELDVPYVGLFGACATFTLSVGTAAVLVDGGYALRALAAVSSHHDSAERQFRYPVEFGSQRPPSAQWTATGAAAVLVGGEPERAAVRVTHVTYGRVVDMGVKDPFNMGGAMAYVAVDTIRRHFEDTGRDFGDYDLVATGDLAAVGHPLATDLLRQAGLDPGDRFTDCGLLLYDRQQQDVHAGGSGCACSGIVFGVRFYPELQRGTLRRVLLVSTGSLHNKMTFQQGESIPTVAHAVAFESTAGEEPS